MKRAPIPLVDYSVSDDEEEEEPTQLVPRPKKRKLPVLSSSLIVPAPVDDPTLHQGRVRTHAHVDGHPISQLLRDVVLDAKKRVPSLEEICKVGINQSSSAGGELHISLSRPIYLRAYQREDFKREIMRISQHQKSFPISFTTFSELTNDERTRTFLVLEVGAGHHELKSLTVALTSILRLLRQQQYYENPRFHASIAWALLDRGALNPSAASASPEDTISDTGYSDQSETVANGNAVSLSPRHLNIANNFPTIPHFPEDLISTLNERYGYTLASTKVGLFDAEFITVKIGKETFTWRLLG